MCRIWGVPRLKVYLDDLGMLTEHRRTPLIHIMSKRQAVSYIMGYLSVLGFGSVLWCKKSSSRRRGSSLPYITGGTQTFVKDKIQLKG